jgi:hypothetical protein
MQKFGIVLVCLAFTTAGCAKKVDQIGAAYVSPLQYETFTCEQISAEAARVSSRAATAMGVQQQNASSDAVAVGIGVIIFWPALFFIKGNGANEAEVARLKGEMDALEQASIQKQCGIQFQRPEPPKKPVSKPSSATPT